MFNIHDLKVIVDIIKDKDAPYIDEIKLHIIKKTEELINTIESYDKCLWSFRWKDHCGDVQGLFKATKEEVENAIGKDVYFGEILGKHSEVYGTLEPGEIKLESDDPWLVKNAVTSGYNPLDYLEFIDK